MCLLLLSLILICSANANEVQVHINVNRVINHISDRFLSFYVNPKIIIENVKKNSEAIEKFASEMGPAYLKLSEIPLDYTIDTTGYVPQKQKQDLHDWKTFHQWLKSVNWIPVVPLPYKPSHWNSIASFTVLNASKISGVDRCVWQLGSDFETTGAAGYVRDLITLQTMADSFVDNLGDWQVIGAELSSGSDPEETRMFTELSKHVVNAIGWMQPAEKLFPEILNYIINDNDPTLRILLSRKAPTWLTFSSSSTMIRPPLKTSRSSSIYGMQWARVLGDSARIGFNAIYKPLNVEDFSGNDFCYFGLLMFNKFMGSKVFEPRIVSGDRFTCHVYSHCTKDKAGSISIMVVNIGETRAKLTLRMSEKHSGSEIMQYILTTRNNTTYLNGEQLLRNTTLEPFTKIKHPTRPITVSLPAMSIGFWILPLANNDICMSDSIFIDDVQKYVRVRTASDLLLQHLIEGNEVKRNNNISKRDKRHQDASAGKPNNIKSKEKSFNKTNTKSENQFQNLSRKRRQATNINGSKVAKRDIPELIHIPGMEMSQFSNKRNQNLDTKLSGDVFFKLGNAPNADYDYVEFNENTDMMPRSEVFENQQAGDSYSPGIFYETYRIQKIIPREQEDTIDIFKKVNTPSAGKHLSRHLHHPSTLSDFNQEKLVFNQDEPNMEKQLSQLRDIFQIGNPRTKRDLYTQYWDFNDKNEMFRNRQSPVLNALSMALSDSENYITKELENTAPNRQYLAYTIQQKLRPVNFGDTSWQENVIVDNSDFEPIDTKPIRNNYVKELAIEESTENNSNVEHVPKFMSMFSDNVNKFVQMLNHHVTGWWNTWA